MEIIRILSSFSSGMMLYIAGSLIQIAMNSDLAGPATLGVNAFVVLIIIVGQAILAILKIEYLEWITLSTFLFVTAVFLFFWFKEKKEAIISNRTIGETHKLILFGLCFNLFVGALFSFMQFIFIGHNLEFPTQLWFGNFRYVPEYAVFVLLPGALIFNLWALTLSQKLQAISFGQDFASALGVDVKRVQKMAVSISLLCSGVVISFFGVFAFVGISFPLVMRNLTPAKYSSKVELTFGPIICGLLFSILDALAYHYPFFGTEIPVGLMTSLLGSVALVCVVIKQNRGKSLQE